MLMLMLVCTRSSSLYIYLQLPVMTSLDAFYRPEVEEGEQEQKEPGTSTSNTKCHLRRYGNVTILRRIDVHHR